MSLPWLRLYTEFAADPKIQILAFEDQRHYVMLLCLKGSGTLDASSVNEVYRERLIAKALGLDPVTAADVKRRLIEGGLIDSNWQPGKWDTRQFPSDYSTARVRKFREKSQRNVTETFPKRPETVVDKNRREEIREEKKHAKRAFDPSKIPDLNLEAWKTWVEYRAERKPAIRPVSMQAAAEELAAFGPDQLTVVKRCMANGYQGLIGPQKMNGKAAAPNHDAAWAEARSRAQAIGFRDPYPHETPGAYMTDIKMAESAPRSGPKSLAALTEKLRMPA